MTVHRFFLDGPLVQGPDRRLPLSAADLHHAVHVLRVRVGEGLDVVGADGRTWRVLVTDVREDGVRATPLEEVSPWPEPHVALFQGVAKGEKMDDIVRQAVEVGAEQIVPVLFARTVVRLDSRKRRERGDRWRRVALAAAKQAKRSSVPTVNDPMSIRDAIVELSQFDGAVVLWEEAEGEAVAEAVRACSLTTDARVAVIIGPEGGLAPEEVEALTGVGARVATLGHNMLRTETAAIVALALAISELGGLGGSGRE